MEWNELIPKWDKLQKYKYNPSTPFAFTEEGIAMLSSVLNSKEAIEVNIVIMRTFVKLRKVISKNNEILHEIFELRREVDFKLYEHDEQIKLIFNVIRKMLKEDEEDDRKIGFNTDI